jgi:hypothetical protein
MAQHASFFPPARRALCCATGQRDEDVVLVFGGEGGPRETMAYDPHRNEWRWMPPTQPEGSGGQMVRFRAQAPRPRFQFNDDAHTWLYDSPERMATLPAALPPTDKNDAGSPTIRCVPVLAIVKITEGKEESAKHTLETWSYDAGANQWKKLNPAPEPDPPAPRAPASRAGTDSPSSRIAPVNRASSKSGPIASTVKILTPPTQAAIRAARDR